MIPSHRAPTHPGEMLLEEFLIPLGLSQVRAASQLRIPLNRLNEIIRGKRGVSADTAVRLSGVFGTSPEFWMNLQSAWDIYHAAKHMHVKLGKVPIQGRQSDSSVSDCEVRTVPWSGEAIEPNVAAEATQQVNVVLCDTELEMVA